MWTQHWSSFQSSENLSARPRLTSVSLLFHLLCLFSSAGFQHLLHWFHSDFFPRPAAKGNLRISERIHSFFWVFICCKYGLWLLRDTQKWKTGSHLLLCLSLCSVGSWAWPSSQRSSNLISRHWLDCLHPAGGRTPTEGLTQLPSAYITFKATHQLCYWLLIKRWKFFWWERIVPFRILIL